MMKKFFVTVLGVAVAMISFFQAKPSAAMEIEESFDVASLGAGKQLLNYEDINWYVNEYDYANPYFKKWYLIPANTVYCFYMSYKAVGIIDSEFPMRIMFKESADAQIDEKIVSAYPGGWGAHCYIENTSENDLYFAITDFNIPETPITADDVEGNFMLQREENTSSMSFTGYYDYIDPSLGLSAIEGDYTLLALKGTKLSDEQILSMFKAYDNKHNNIKSLELISTDYVDEIGEYNVSLKAIDQSDNETTFNFKLKVVKPVDPVVFGPESIVVKASELSQFTLSSLLSQYKGFYGAQTCQIYLDEGSYDTFMNVIDNLSSGTITIAGKFSGGKIATFDVLLVIEDDIGPTIYANEFLLETTTVVEMSEDELMEYVEDMLAKLGISASNLSIVDNTYSGHGTVEGTYNVSFSYIDENNEQQMVSLVIEANDVKSYKNYYIYGSVILASILFLGGAIIFTRRRQKRVNR